MKSKLISLLFLLSVVTAQYPGFKSTISQNGLSYGAQVGVELLEKGITTLQIPTQTGTVDTGVIGKIDYVLSNIVLQELQLPQKSASIVPGQGITLQIAGITCTVTLNWQYKEHDWPYVSDSGTAVVEVSNTGAAVTVQITDSNGRPFFTVLSDQVSIGSLTIHLNGGASWLYNVFVTLFSGNIRDGIQTALTQALTQNIDSGLNVAASTMPIEQPINSQVEIDFPLLSNPIFNPTYFYLPQLGEFYQTASKTECPATICPSNPVADTVSDQMLQMMISDYVADTATYVYFNLGLLNAFVTDTMLPSWSPVRLNTNSFQYLLPPLYNAYPNQNMTLNLACTAPPETVFSPSGATIYTMGTMQVNVISSTGASTVAFVLSGSANFTATALLDGTVIYGNLTSANSNLALSQSNIGPFDPSILDKLIQLLLSNGVLPAVNVYLKQGFVLPTIQGVTFNNPSLGWGNRYLSVSTDVTYTPPANQNEPKIVANF